MFDDEDVALAYCQEKSFSFHLDVCHSTSLVLLKTWKRRLKALFILLRFPKGYT